MEENVLSTAVLQFSLKFLNELDKTRSVVSSPLSAEILLALLALGDTKQTCKELLTVLGFPDDAAIRTSFAQLSERLKNIEGATLDVANRIYMNIGAELEPQIQKDAVDVFDADFEVMDFKDGAAVATHVNNWVEKKTNQKIQKIMTPSDVKESQEMVLINAIYFKGNWTDPFKKKHTSEKEFYVDANTTIMVPMMTKIERFKFGMYSELEAEILVLPYKGGESKLAIVLPKSYEPDALDEVIRKIGEGHNIMKEIDEIGSVSIRVFLPKFKIETEMNLTDVLKNLGLKSMFTAGFDNLLKSRQPVHVSDAIQKAVIEVNEEGTEAAAVTKMILMKKSMPREFKADHPFLYLLLGPADVPLFVGIYRGDENAPKSEKRHTSGIEVYSVEDDKVTIV